MLNLEQDNHNGQRTEPVTFLSILNDFAGKTSAHAVPEVVLNPRIVAKLFWSLLLTVAFVIFCIQTSRLLSNYYTFHTNLDLVSSEEVEFPAVTICNFNRMKRSKLDENSRFEWVLKLEDKDFLKDIIGDPAYYYWLWSSDYWLDSSSKSQVPNTDSPQTVNGNRKRRETFLYESLFSDSDYSYWLEWSSYIGLFDELGDDFASKILAEIVPTKEELRTMGHQADDFILQCNFNTAKCDYRNFTTSQNNQYGNCFTFNATQQEKRGRGISKVGSDYGLHLTLFIEKLQYVGLFTEESGVRVAIHPKNIMPHPEDVGISVTPGFATSIGLRQVELKRLGGRYGKCKDAKTKNHLSSDKYDYSIISCQKKCLLDHMKEKCGCVNNIYDDYANIPNCDKDATDKNRVRCKQQVENNFLSNKLECDCPAPCHEYIHNMKLSTALWPSEIYQPHLKDKLEKENITAYRSLNNSEISRENLVRVKIYFEELNYELIEQVPAHTVPEVLGSIGGLLGLYIGFSALTIFEVVVLVYHLTKLAFQKAIPRINTMIESRKNSSEA